MSPCKWKVEAHFSEKAYYIVVLAAEIWSLWNKSQSRAPPQTDPFLRVPAPVSWERWDDVWYNLRIFQSESMAIFPADSGHYLLSAHDDEQGDRFEWGNDFCFHFSFFSSWTASQLCWVLIIPVKYICVSWLHWLLSRQVTGSSKYSHSDLSLFSQYIFGHQIAKQQRFVPLLKHRGPHCAL